MGANVSEEKPAYTEEQKKDGALMTNFFQHPTKENYNKILVFYNESKPESKLFFMMVRKQYGFGGGVTDEEREFLISNENRLLSPDTVLSPLDLDCLWGLFGVTGDRKYSDRVKSVLSDDRVHVFTKGSAKWSYGSFVDQGYIQE